MYYLRILLLLCSFVFVLNPLLCQEKVKPKKGDGVKSLLIRHNRPGTQYEKEFIQLNKGKFGKNNSLLLGVSYTLPPKKNAASPAVAAAPTKPSAPATVQSPIGTKKSESLFGKQYANYTVQSNELQGATFYVVSGHGGPDPGAIGKMGRNEMHEHAYAYDIALRLARALMMKGATVHIIIQNPSVGISDTQYLTNNKRATCMGQTIPLGQVARLKQRSAKINELHQKVGKGYARGIFLHLDSRSKNQKIDVFFYHSQQTASKQLANTMRNTFSQKYNRHQPSRGFSGTVSERSLYVLNNTTPVSVYVELGNIQNAFDQRRFVLDDNRQALANWMCDAFVADYNAHKKKH